MQQSVQERQERQGVEFQFDALDTPEQRVWKQNRADLMRVSASVAGFRFCTGVAFILDPSTESSWRHLGNRLFVPTFTVASIVDIPQGGIGTNKREEVAADVAHLIPHHRKRETHWATVRPVNLSMGMPRFSVDHVNGAWDFRAIPRDIVTANRNGRQFNVERDTYTLPVDSRLFPVFNLIETRMTAYAFQNCRAWRPHSPTLQPALADRDAITAPVRSWMPRAYLGFPAKMLPRLFGRALGGDDRVAPEPLCDAFTEALTGRQAWIAPQDGRVTAVTRGSYHNILVTRIAMDLEDGTTEEVRFSRGCTICRGNTCRFRAGEVVAQEPMSLPRSWDVMSAEQHWNEARRQFGTDIVAAMHLWFDRQAVHIVPDVVHLPSELCTRAAVGNAIDSQLLWDITSATDAQRPYYVEALDAIVPPPIPLTRWTQFLMTLPGHVHCNLTPSIRDNH